MFVLPQLITAAEFESHLLTCNSKKFLNHHHLRSLPAGQRRPPEEKAGDRGPHQIRAAAKQIRGQREGQAAQEEEEPVMCDAGFACLSFLGSVGRS